MGKYASRDGGSSVAWVDITGKPATFTPAVHGDTAHSTAYAPLASPTFTTRITVNGGAAVGSYFETASGYASIIFSGTAGVTKGVLTTYDGKVYLGRLNGGGTGAEADLLIDGSGNILMNQSLYVAASVVAGALKTANWSIEEDGYGNELHKYQGVLKWYVTPAGYMRTADNMEPKASMTP